MTSYRPPAELIGTRVNPRLLGLSLLASVGLAASPPGLAADGACPAPATFRLDPEIAARRDAPDVPTHLEADQAEYDQRNGVYTATGNAVLERVDQTLRADQLRFEAASERADASGNVRYTETGLEVIGTQGFFDMNDRRGALDDARFRLVPSEAHGRAERVELRGDEAAFEDVRYTGCPPDQADWWLASPDLTLNRAEGFGTARHAYLTFFGVPLLYTPYISFPIDDRRKTGVLPPRFGYSGDSGLDLAVPYYLNLAPNYDATLTPRLVSRRGLMLGAEARWLTPLIGSRAYVEYLPDDRLADRDRWLAHLDIADQWQGPLYFNAAFNRVSDRDYLEDFNLIGGLATTSEDNLLSSATLGYHGGNWNLRGLVQHWQSLDDDLAPVNRPFRVIPRVTFDYRQAPVDSNLSQSFSADYARFTHPHPELVDVGNRADAFYAATYRHERLAYYVAPTVGYRYTAYQLDRTAANDALSDDPSRGLPLFSLDSGIFLERELGWFGRSLLQTLEPRLFYLYVPYENQDSLPRFDTEVSELTLSRLFEYNRFTGPDRIGDTNHIALGITSRLLDTASGREYLRVGVGQAYYQERRRVTIGAPTPLDTRRVSPILGEARASVGHWTAYANVAWDTYEDSLNQRTLRVSYQPGPRQAVNLAYRMRSALYGEPLELTELTAVWPVNPRWLVLSGWQYSLETNTTLERFAGVAYSACCWTARAVVREYVRDGDEDSNFGIMFQLELTGLGALGQSLDQFLSEVVSGYRFNR